MTPFEQEWYDKFMRNMVTLATLMKLAGAGKLDPEKVQAWAGERMEGHGI